MKSGGPVLCPPPCLIHNVVSYPIFFVDVEASWRRLSRQPKS
jgi:hypothetical protein